MTLTRRKPERESYALLGCKSSFDFFPSRWISAAKNITEEFGCIEDVSPDAIHPSTIDDGNEDLNSNRISHDGRLDLIDVGTFVAIKAPASFEMFYAMKIVRKGTTPEHMSDSSEEHFVVAGEPYLVGK